MRKVRKKKREEAREQVEPNDPSRFVTSSSAGTFGLEFPHEEVTRPGKNDDAHSRFLAGLDPGSQLRSGFL